MISKFFKFFDIFGHEFKMSIGNGHGDTYRSVVGGMATLVLYFFTIYFLVIKIG